ncbi:YceI family protein [Limibacter armeniacum]|uniref:YceI family protein n=1 Tax=Limibacter armeniacum TaxID=466084 RepID=UPI002FE55EC1
MNKATKFAAIGFMSFAMVACGAKQENTEEAQAGVTTETAAAEGLAAGSYAIVDSASSVKWTGKKVGGEHFGTISVSEGSFEIAEGTVKSGSFTIDMSSVAVSDIPAEDEMNAKLVGHLKADDFFGVENFPTASFEISSVEAVEGAYNVTGMLTLKDSTQEVSFPATIETAEGTATVAAKFSIDRTKFGITYSSKSILGDAADKFIYDDVEIELNVTAAAEVVEATVEADETAEASAEATEATEESAE